MKSFFKKDAGLSTGAKRAADRRRAQAVWADGFYRSVTQDGRPLFTVSRQVRRAEERLAEEAAERAERKDVRAEALKVARSASVRSQFEGRFGQPRRRGADKAATPKGGRGRLATAGKLGAAS